MDWDVELDTIGLLCPLPVLKARKRLISMKNGEVLRMLADDPASVIDVPHFCVESGHVLLLHEVGNGHLSFLIRKLA
jgi:tRNA 2-thiouridine synthesizing protein A|tara:strand:+ start:295 stop:525 length:231 start_codon:yes stop_codon:yes gene_type:complete